MMTRTQAAPFHGGWIAISAVLSLAVSTPVSAASLVLFNTGVNDDGTVLATPGSSDFHWSIATDLQTLLPLQALTAIDPNNGWIANSSSGTAQSGWIGPNPESQATGTYHYYQYFTIPKGATKLSITGQWATDDSARLYLNGHEIPSARTEDSNDPSPWTVFQSFATDDPALFLPGTTNQLWAEIINTGGPTGFQAQLSGTYAPAPGPLPLMGVAAAFASSRRLRRSLMARRGRS